MNYARTPFEVLKMKLAECRGLAPLARRRALVSTEPRLACPVDIPNWFQFAICILKFAFKVPVAGLAPALSKV